MLVVLLLLVRAASAGCPASAASLQSALDGAQLSFSAMDGAGFKAATTEAEAQAACLSEVVPSGVAARLHRVMGLRAFVDGDEEGARAAFSAARAIEPDYLLPEAMVPADHPVRRLYTEATGTRLATVAVPAPQSGHVEFDGVSGLRRPTERPTLALVVQDNGSVRASGYLQPNDPMLGYAGRTPPAVASVPVRASGEKKGPNAPLTVVACIALAAAGTTWGLTGAANHAFESSTSTEYETLEGLRARNNTLFFVSVGASVATLGAGVGAVVAGHW